MKKTIFIYGNIPSSKNSKVMGKFLSKTVTKWLRLYGIKSYSSSRKTVEHFVKVKKTYDMLELLSPIKEFTKYPLKLSYHFVRGSKHKWDFGNVCQVINDVMTAYNVIPDDNVDYILPFPLEIDGKYWSYDKNNPGVFIQIEEMEDND